MRKLSENEVMRAIIGELMDAGIPANLRGYEYIKDALRIVLEDPDKIHAAMKEIYPVIAEQYQLSVYTVEHSMRKAVEACFERGDMDWIQKRFGRQIDPKSGKLTNMAFIAGLADQIRLELKAYDDDDDVEV